MAFGLSLTFDYSLHYIEGLIQIKKTQLTIYVDKNNKKSKKSVNNFDTDIFLMCEE